MGYSKIIKPDPQRFPNIYIPPKPQKKLKRELQISEDEAKALVESLLIPASELIPIMEEHLDLEEEIDTEISIDNASIAPNKLVESKFSSEGYNVPEPLYIENSLFLNAYMDQICNLLSTYVKLEESKKSVKSRRKPRTARS